MKNDKLINESFQTDVQIANENASDTQSVRQTQTDEKRNNSANTQPQKSLKSVPAIDIFLGFGIDEMHHQELQQKRGLSLSNYSSHFLSGHLVDKELIEKWIYTNARSAKKLGLDNVKNLESLCEQKIVCIITDTSGNIVQLRPYKKAFTNVDVKPFIKIADGYTDTSTAYLFESEIKALAGMELGCQIVIGTFGISTFIGKNFNSLADLINGLCIKKIVIVTDNEIKSDPLLPNYKEKVEKRYDVEKYAIVLAKKLEDKGIEVKVAVIPNEYREKGKVDMDSYLMKLRQNNYDFSNQNPENLFWLFSISDYLDFIFCRGEYKNNKNSQEYHNGAECQSILDDAFNYYSNTAGEAISNFIIIHDRTEIAENGDHERILTLKNTIGVKKDEIRVEASFLINLANFKEKCLTLGDFHFSGNHSDLDRVIRKIIDAALNVPSIYIINGYGRYNTMKHDIWFFENCAICKGELIEPVNGIFVIDHKNYTISSVAPYYGDANQKPRLDISANHSVSEIADLFANLHGNNKSFPALVAFLYYLGSFVSHLFENDGFPLLYLYGVSQSGKTTIMRFLHKLIGLITGGGSFQETTSNALNTILKSYRGLPFHLDEVNSENARSNRISVETLKSCFNRNATTKGTADGKTTTFKPEGTLILSGENLINHAPGFISRTIAIHIAKPTDDVFLPENIQSKKKLTELDVSISCVLRDFLIELTKIEQKDWELFEQQMKDWQEYLKNAGAEYRVARNYSIILSTASLLNLALSQEQIKYITELVIGTNEWLNESDAINDVIEKAISAFEAYPSTSKFITIAEHKSRKSVFLYVRGLLDAANRVSTDIVLTPAALTEYFKTKNYYIDKGKGKICGKTKSGIYLDLNNCPIELIELVQQHEGAKK